MNWPKCVIPLAVEAVTTDVDRGKFFVGNLDACIVPVLVEFGFDGKSCLGCSIGNGVVNHLLTYKWPSTPVLCNVAEHPVFDLIPFTRAWREMTHRYP